MDLDKGMNPETAQAAEEEARKQSGTDLSPATDIASGAGDVAAAAADGTVAAVIEGVGSVLSGAADVVGGIFSVFDV